MEHEVYNWLVNKGNMIIQRSGDRIALVLNYEEGECCSLTYSDTTDIIELLTNISGQIWGDPDYKRKAYTNQLYSKNENGYYWEIDAAQLQLKFNEIENAIEIKCNRDHKLNLELNYVVEMIQILEHLNDIRR